MLAGTRDPVADNVPKINIAVLCRWVHAARRAADFPVSTQGGEFSFWFMSYDKFIEGKIKSVKYRGIAPLPFTAPLWEWQKQIVSLALRKGCYALFEECGLGKTIQQLEWAHQVNVFTGEPVLILAPLAVGAQTKREGEKFGIKCTLCREASDVDPKGINIVNYQRLDKFDTTMFKGVVLDESSILKSFNGKTRQQLSDAFQKTRFKLCCTATPSPNDFTELGQHADFLGICSPSQMLATYFINDTFDTGTWRLKGHAEEAFWKWVSTWACCISKPSDLGFSDEGFNLPEVTMEVITVSVDHRADEGSEELFRNPNVNATELHRENRRTIIDRCNAAAKIVNSSGESFIVWCHSIDESDLLTKLIPDAVEVDGSLDIETKEERLNAFSTGAARVIVTKGKIAGFGMNWQHCHNDLYIGLNHSFETFYQCGKRIHRFGQKSAISRYIIQTDTENGVMKSLMRKQGQHEQMRQLIKFSRDQINGSSEITFMNTSITKKEGQNWTLYNGDCVRVAKQLESDSIGFSVFSPPFADLFTYSGDIQDMGNCNGMEEFMEQFGFLIDELGRITMPGRECAVHCCDLLATKWKDGAIEFKDFSSAISDAFRSRGWLFHSRITIWKSPVTEMQRTKAHGLLYKTLQSDSSKSRVGAADYLLIFRKRGDNPIPITHTPYDLPLSLWQELASPVWMTVNQSRVLNGEFAREDKDERHICPLQLDVIDRALMLWSAKGDLVFSPFAGIGSEGYGAIKAGRRFVGSELKPSYFKTACDYLTQANADAASEFQFDPA